MSEAPKRIWADGDADLVKAAIKRALEAAAKKIATQRGTVYGDDSPQTTKWINGNNSAVSSALTIIRALDPAQFIEEPKEEVE